MATYNFSTISAAQALTISGTDTLVLDLGDGQGTRVLFAGDSDQVTIVAGGRTVVFGAGAAGAAKSYPAGGALFVGGPGDDQQALDAGSDGLFGGLGNDTLAGGAADDVLQGNQGNDSLNGGSGHDVVYGGRDNDVIDTGAEGSSGDFAQGNLGDDTVVGSATGGDILIGGQGDDLINAFAVSDLGGGVYEPVNGRIGTGSDILNGNRGDDLIFAGFGDDRMLGEDGADYLFDYGGQDTIEGGVGEDTIVELEAIQGVIAGGDGNDLLLAAGTGVADVGAGDDAVLFFGGEFANRFELKLGDGDDVCFVASDTPNPADAFTVDGGAGNDAINTGDGSDLIAGGAGADTIDGWAGADTVAGGLGADVFEFFSGEALTKLATLDQIVDWSSEDRLYFADADTGDAIGKADATNLVSAVRFDYASALSYANAQIGGGTIDYVVVQVAGDVFVFCDSYYDAGFADSAVKLVGRSLADIGTVNFTDAAE